MNVPFSQLRQQDNLLSFYMLIADSGKEYKKWSTFSFHLSANKNFCWSPWYLRFWRAKHQLSVKGHWAPLPPPMRRPTRCVDEKHVWRGNHTWIVRHQEDDAHMVEWTRRLLDSAVGSPAACLACTLILAAADPCLFVSNTSIIVTS